MAGIKKVTLVSALALAVSGCNMYKLEELRHTTMSGTPFQNELARLYMDFASEEEKNYDWGNSWYFADKGLSLAYGKDAGPEDLKNWDIPAEVLPDMEKARIALMAVLTPDLMRASPSRAAAAQFYFDCWVEQQEENWQEEDIAYCRDNLMAALDDLKAPGAKRMAKTEAAPKPAKKAVEAEAEEAMPEPVEPKEDAPKEDVKKETEDAKVEIAHEPADGEVKEEPKEAKKAEEPKAVKAPKAVKEGEPKEVFVPDTTSYAVFFETNKAEVSEPGMNVITEIIKSLSGVPDYVVILHTSKDSPGMAADRIHVIRKLLTAGGIKEKSVKVSSGKTEIETGKSVSRRVEIFLNE